MTTIHITIQEYPININMEKLTYIDIQNKVSPLIVKGKGVLVVTQLIDFEKNCDNEYEETTTLFYASQLREIADYLDLLNKEHI